MGNKKKNYRKSSSNYVAATINRYNTDEESAMGSTSAYYGAMKKALSKGYKDNSIKYNVKGPLAMCGYSIDHPHVTLSFHDPDSGELHTKIGSDITHTQFEIPDDSSTNFIIDGEEQVIPSAGMWSMKIQSEFDDKNIGTISDQYSGYYDIHNQNVNNENSFIVKTTLISDDLESKYDKKNLPRPILIFRVDKDYKGRYNVDRAVLTTNYDGHDRMSLGSANPYYGDVDRDRESTLGPVLAPQHFKRDHAKQAEPSSQDLFREELDRYVAELAEKYPNSGLSVSVSQKSHKLYDRDSDQKYDAGNLTKVLSAITLIRLFDEKGLDWEYNKNNDQLIYQILGDSEMGKAIKHVYMKGNVGEVSSTKPLYVKLVSSDAGPTVLQLLTETSGLPWQLTISPSELVETLDKIPEMKFSCDEHEFARCLKQTSLVYRPGSCVHDSDVGYAIVGYLIKRLSGYSSCEDSILESCIKLGMNDSFFVSRKQAHKEFGRSKFGFASSSGLVCSVNDIDNMLNSFQTNVERVKHMRMSLRPQYRVDKDSSVYSALGWKVSSYLTKDQKNIKYTTIDASGYGGIGHGVRGTIIPEYSLNVSFGVKGCTGSSYSDLSVKIVDKAVSLYVKYIAKRRCPCVPLDRCETLARCPPLFHHCSLSLRESCNCCKPQTTICKPKLNFCAKASFGFGCKRQVHHKSYHCCNRRHHKISKCPHHNNTPVDYGGQCLEDLCTKKIKLVPLIATVKCTDSLYVKKTSEGGFYLQLGDTEDSRETLMIDVVHDKYGQSYRMVKDGLPSEQIKLYYAKTEKGNPIWGISIWGMCYFNQKYVKSRISKIQYKYDMIKQELQDNPYAINQSAEPIGKDFVIPENIGVRAGTAAVLGGLAGLGLGVAAAGALGSGSSPYYYDPYGQYYYTTSPYYVPPYWGVGGYRRYPGWYWEPYRWWHPRLRRYVWRRRRRYGRRPSWWGRRGRRGPGGRRRARRRRMRRRRRRRRIADDIEGISKYYDDEEGYSDDGSGYSDNSDYENEQNNDENVLFDSEEEQETDDESTIDDEEEEEEEEEVPSNNNNNNNNNNNYSYKKSCVNSYGRSCNSNNMN